MYANGHDVNEFSFKVVEAVGYECANILLS